MLISDLKNRLQSKIHGQSLNKVQDIYNLIYEAGSNFLLAADPNETIRVATIENALYDQVYSYASPTDLKGDKIIDIRAQINRTPADNFSKQYSTEFDMYKSLSNNEFAVEYNTTIKTIRIAKNLKAGVLMNGCDTLTSNGTWTAGGNATGLATDTINYLTGGGSLKFDISASGSSAYIENSTMTTVDLTSYSGVGAMFIWAYIPSTTVVTAINLRWGSDSSNYYTASVTTRHDATAFTVGWNLLRFDWPTSSTGTPVITLMDYLRVTFTYNGTAVSGCRVDSIMAKLGSIYELVYYSKYIFRNSAGTWIEKPSADTDLINLDVDSFNCLLYEVAYLAAQEIQGKDDTVDAEFFKTQRDGVWKRYGITYKSQAIKTGSTYYRTRGMRRR